MFLYKLFYVACDHLFHLVGTNKMADQPERRQTRSSTRQDGKLRDKREREGQAAENPPPELTCASDTLLASVSDEPDDNTLRDGESQDDSSTPVHQDSPQRASSPSQQRKKNKRKRKANTEHLPDPMHLPVRMNGLTESETREYRHLHGSGTGPRPVPDEQSQQIAHDHEAAILLQRAEYETRDSAIAATLADQACRSGYVAQETLSARGEVRDEMVPNKNPAEKQNTAVNAASIHVAKALPSAQTSESQPERKSNLPPSRASSPPQAALGKFPPSIPLPPRLIPLPASEMGPPLSLDQQKDRGNIKQAQQEYPQGRSQSECPPSFFWMPTESPMTWQHQGQPPSHAPLQHPVNSDGSSQVPHSQRPGMFHQHPAHISQKDFICSISPSGWLPDVRGNDVRLLTDTIWSLRASLRILMALRGKGPKVSATTFDDIEEVAKTLERFLRDYRTDQVGMKLERIED